MLPKELTRESKNRLKSIRGQIDGLIKLIDNDNSIEKILTQFKAADKALQNVHCLFLDEVIRKTLALKIVEVLEICPGNCGQEEKIEFIRKQFPKFESEELSEKMKEVRMIYKLIKKRTQ